MEYTSEQFHLLHSYYYNHKFVKKHENNKDRIAIWGEQYDKIYNKYTESKKKYNELYGELPSDKWLFSLFELGQNINDI